MQAGTFVQTIEERQGLKISCPEEIAYRQGWIAAEQVESLAAPLRKTGYGQYLLQLVETDAHRTGENGGR
jgi:glucose-1-phosphate thymidylyltransferase